jgi:hypothetical protein
MEKSVYRMEIPIDGVPETVEIADISIDDVILDPENPRIGYWMDNVSRFTDTTTQEDLLLAVKGSGLDEYNSLKRSIEAGGGATEMIWVMRKEGKYLCIDGNTRIIIYRDLRAKYPRKDTYKTIKARILPEGTDDRAKNFIRLIAHLRAQNDWQAYERARMLYILWEHKGYTEEDLKNTTKLSISNIKKWIAAYKAMNDQFLPKYGNKADALMKFSYFVEYESTKIKNGMRRLGLDERNFCDWVGQEEIIRAQDVRDLKRIFENEKAAELLGQEGFEAAKEELSLSVPAYGSRLFEHIEKCIYGLREMSRDEERSIVTGEDSNKREYILELYKELTSFVDLIHKYEKK